MNKWRKIQIIVVICFVTFAIGVGAGAYVHEQELVHVDGVSWYYNSTAPFDLLANDTSGFYEHIGTEFNVTLKCFGCYFNSLANGAGVSSPFIFVSFANQVTQLNVTVQTPNSMYNGWLDIVVT